MNNAIKINSAFATSNSKIIEDLCVWIDENCDSLIGWEQLSKDSGLSHKDLIAFFQLYKHQTPMVYLRQVRNHKKAMSEVIH